MFCIGTHDIAIHEVNCLSKLYDIKMVLWPNMKGTIGMRLGHRLQ